MLNLEQLLKSAPKMPATTGQWVSVYLEPMIGSGERFTVLVATVTSTGEVQVKQAIRKEVIDAMYGFKSQAFTNMIELIAHSLKHHLDKTKDFASWIPPVNSVTVGKPRSAASSSTTGILRQAVSLSSSLSSLLVTEEDNKTSKKGTSRSNDRWPEQVFDTVTGINKKLEVYFNQNFTFTDGHRPARIFYLSEDAAINTGKLFPSSLNEQVKDGKAKISDLSLIKKQGDVFNRDVHQMLIYRPEEDSPAYNDRQINTINSAFLSLQDLADTYDVSITSVTTPEQAARLILKTAA